MYQYFCIISNKMLPKYRESYVRTQLGIVLFLCLHFHGLHNFINVMEGG